MKRAISLIIIFCLNISTLAAGASAAEQSGEVNEKISPGIVGWGNFIVPGLGATLLDQPGKGLTEAGLEIGTFYSGTLLAPETRFRIDGTVDLPVSGNINSAAIAETLQQFGLKYHFYNTFYHYREAALEVADTAREKNNPQPLYMGSAWDSFKSPFEWSNLNSLWVWPVVLGGTAYLTISYATTTVTRQNYQLTATSEALYGFSIAGANPVGSYMGEDPLFRGFMQRELIAETGSIPVAIVAQSLVFSVLHENHANAFAVGIYLGLSTLYNHGDLRKAMAVHFWLDMMDGLFTYLSTRRAAGEGAPFMPPVGSMFRFEF
jgi:membrane protease YdiL (CAAX protease family)